MIERIAHRLALFHHDAQTGGEINEMGMVKTIRFNHEENFSQTEPFIDLTIPASLHRLIKIDANSFLENNQQLLENRVKRGKIRDCHGDLHLEHIICDGDSIAVFDCLEFNERFRYEDIAAEIAFLAMDIDFNGYREVSDKFASSYIACSGDKEVALLLDFYKCYYAFVRGKVTSFRLNEKQLPASERIAIVELARRYFSFAGKYATKLKKPTLIIVCGLMGTGKSQMTKNLASKLGVETVVMDVLRKEMLGVPVQQRCYDDFGKGIYSNETTQMIYERALFIAKEKLMEGKSIIVDASFKKHSQRLAAKQLAADSGADFIAIQCVCPDDVIEARLKNWASRKGGASDGRWEIYAMQKQTTDDFGQLNPHEFFSVDTSGDKENSLFEALAQMMKRLT